MYNKLFLTGVRFAKDIVDRGHKKGVLCLTCGIYCGELVCPKCILFDKCKLCGIVCKVTPTNLLYFYLRKQGDRNICEEYAQEVKTLCRKLEEGFCEDCICWEDFIRNKCFICGVKFLNNYKNYKENGNCCTGCALVVLARYKVLDKNGNFKNPTYDRSKSKRLDIKKLFEELEITLPK